MATNNHPAHGPVSLERLHQISEILSKAAAQSDGGNLGYAMADAVKVIDEVIAAFGAEPVAWRWFHLNQWHVTNNEDRAMDLAWDGVKVIPLYTAPPAPVAMKDHQIREMVNDLRDIAIEYHGAQQLRERIARTVRAAMLQAGNYPVTTDGWIPVSERMPDSNCLYLCWGTYFEGDEPDYIPAYFFAHQTNGWTEWQPVEDDCNHREVIITHWMPLPAPPQQDVKS